MKYVFVRLGEIKVLLKQDEHDVLMDDKSLSNAVFKSKFGHSGVNRFMPESVNLEIVSNPF